MRAIGNPSPKPRSAIVLVVILLALCALEINWLYNWHRANDELAFANVRRSGQNTLDQRKIRELRTAAVRIDGLFLRLQDPFTSNPQQPSIVSSRPSAAEPMVIQDFVKGGLAAVRTGTVNAESNVGYQLSSDRLEFHRLVPLIVQEENSNVFLFIDHLNFERPKATGPFSMKPTVLRTRVSARLFTSANPR